MGVCGLLWVPGSGVATGTQNLLSTYSGVTYGSTV